MTSVDAADGLASASGKGENQVVSELHRRMVLVPVEQADGFERTMAALNKKALSFGLEPIRVLSSAAARYRREIRAVGGTSETMLARLVRVKDDEAVRNPVLISEIEIEYPVIRLGNWAVIGKVETLGESSLTLCATEEESDRDEVARRSGTAMTCDHCNLERKRQGIYVLRDNSGDVDMRRYLQVGTGCLEAFTGIDPAAALFMAKMHQAFRELDGDLDREGGGGRCNAVDTESYLFDSWFLSSRVGFISTKAAAETGSISTWESALGIGDALERSIELRSAHANALNARAGLGKRIRDWVMSEEAGSWGMDPLFLANARAVVREPAIQVKASHLAIAAGAVAAFRRHEDRMAAGMKPSSHVGKPGEKLTAELWVKRALEVPNPYSRKKRYMVLLEDAAGNVLKWTSSSVPVEVSAGSRQRLVARFTVAGHDEYRGAKQTIVQRLAVIEWR